VCEVLAASPSDAAQWGAGAAVFDKKKELGRHERLVVLGSEAMGEGHMAVSQLIHMAVIHVDILTTESAPHDKTRTIVTSVLGDHLCRKVWRGENEHRQATASDDGRATANTRRCTIM